MFSMFVSSHSCLLVLCEFTEDGVYTGLGSGHGQSPDRNPEGQEEGPVRNPKGLEEGLNLEGQEGGPDLEGLEGGLNRTGDPNPEGEDPNLFDPKGDKSFKEVHVRVRLFPSPLYECISGPLDCYPNKFQGLVSHDFLGAPFGSTHELLQNIV